MVANIGAMSGVRGGRGGKGDAKSSRREEWLEQKGGSVILRSCATKNP